MSPRAVRCGSLNAHATNVIAIAIDAQGATLATAGEDGDIALWDVRTRRLRRRFEEHCEATSALALAQGLLFIGADKRLSVRRDDRTVAAADYPSLAITDLAVTA
jgi:WD40 repeat protein